MLKAKGLNSVLMETCSTTPGITCAVLMNVDGALLSHHKTPNADVQVLCAIVSSAWTQFEKHGRAALCDDQLGVLLFECERGRIGVSKIVNNLLICLQTDANVEYGLIKTKLQAVVSALKEPLSELSF